MSKSILFADDHPLLLEGYKQCVKGFETVINAASGNEAYNLILKNEPCIAVLDYNMPILNGLEVASLCLQNNIKTKIIILTLYKEKSILNEVGKSINGYVLKEDAITELESCIDKVSVGENYISPKAKKNMHLLKDAKGVVEELTSSEVKVLRLLSKEMSSSEIAEILFVSKRTIEKHRSNIISKLGIKSSQNSLLLWTKEHKELLE